MLFSLLQKGVEHFPSWPEIDNQRIIKKQMWDEDTVAATSPE